jgi:hypothetical protein
MNAAEAAAGSSQAALQCQLQAAKALIEAQARQVMNVCKKT